MAWRQIAGAIWAGGMTDGRARQAGGERSPPAFFRRAAWPNGLERRHVEGPVQRMGYRALGTALAVVAGDQAFLGRLHRLPKARRDRAWQLVVALAACVR